MINGTQIPTIDVVLVTLVTEESVPQEYAVDTASKIGVEAQLEVQDGVKLIVKSVLKAQKKQTSVLTGHKLTLLDNLFIPEVVKILQGGTLKTQDVAVSGTGTKQVETATIVGTISASGNAEVVVTSVLFTEQTLSVAVLNEDTASEVAVKIRTALGLNASVVANFTIGGTGATVVLTAISEAADDDTLNVAFDNDTCVGLTTGATSVDTTPGVAPDTEEEVIGYTPPVAGEAVDLTTFVLTAYSAQYNTAGEIVNYEKIEYPNCTGRPIALSSEDGVFRAPEYIIDSAPDSGEAPYDIDYVTELPTVS